MLKEITIIICAFLMLLMLSFENRTHSGRFK